MRYKIGDTSHLLDIIDTINETGIPDETILVSFDIVNMFPSIDNVKGMDAVRLALYTRDSNKPSTECVLEVLEICLYNNNSIFDTNHLLQTNGTATGSPNSCSYSDIAINRIDRLIEQEQANNFKELSFFGRYRDDCFVLWNGSKDRLDEFFSFLNVLDCDLKFIMEIGNDHLCFLDLKISISSNKLMTTVYSKPTDSHLYLHSTSCHKPSSINILHP